MLPTWLCFLGMLCCVRLPKLGVIRASIKRMNVQWTRCVSEQSILHGRRVFPQADTFCLARIGAC